MRHESSLFLRSLATCVVVISSAGLPVAAQQQPGWTGWDYEQFAVPSGWSRPPAYGLNDAGAFIGTSYSYSSSSQYAAGMLFSPGRDPVIFEALPGHRRTDVIDLNNSGTALVYSGADTNTRQAFLYRDGTRTLLPAESGTYTTAIDLNNRGDTLMARSADSNSPMDRGFIVHADGTQTQLPGAVGQRIEPQSLNDAGQVAGYMTDGAQYRTFLYSGGQMALAPEGFNGWRLDADGRVLGSFSSVGGTPWRAAAFENGQLNVLPDLPGYSTTLFGVDDDEGFYAVDSMGSNGRTRAFLLQDGVYTEFTAGLGPVTESMLLDMNERGQILYHARGTLADGTGWFENTYLWDNGSVTDLGALMGRLALGNPLDTYGASLNEQGQVLVTTRGELFVITPVPEPATFALMLAGLCAGVSLRRRAAARMTA